MPSMSSNPAPAAVAPFYWNVRGERGYETHFVARSPDRWAGRPDDPRLFADQVHRVDTLDPLKLLHFFDGREAAAVVPPDDLHMIGAALGVRAARSRIPPVGGLGPARAIQGPGRGR